ncbi:hypothetical protein [Bradyrhizobium iriomotense]|uniref:Uncharacterized protein n=1 Tax=Bradyrhizobium iriomotense TaxID=441950 RepID=A0ABQ6AWF2_9BRAD|nr:hypothetical protein [Bradyrhizobium iriomotense]GLR86529.1 hypothetical protein GCM10007857_32400 [Bradyrhizobium iriomotense]
MNTELTITANLPVAALEAICDPTMPAAWLAYLERSARTAREANFHALAAAVLYIYSATVWTPSKADRKSIKELRVIVAKSFGELELPNSNAKRATRYKYTKLSLDIAAHKTVWPLALHAAKLQSIEAGVAYLAEQFSDRATSVADLARHFGHAPAEAQGAKGTTKEFFFLGLCALVKRTQKAEQPIPIAKSVELLTRGVAEQERLNLIRWLLSQTSDQAVPELIEILQRFVRPKYGNT